MKIKVMGFEETPLPPPPHAAAAAAATSGSKKIPGIFGDLDVVMTNVSGMDVNDDDGGIEDLIAEIHDDSESDEEEMLWPGFKKHVWGAAMGVKREPEREERGGSEEECSPLYRMDFTSEADIFVSSPSRKSNDFVL